MYPADIYVKERDPGPEAWNISYRDDDEVEMFPSNYSVTSEGIAYIIYRILHEGSCFIEFIKRVGEKR